MPHTSPVTLLKTLDYSPNESESATTHRQIANRNCCNPVDEANRQKLLQTIC
jgi:hypothetical protein